MFAYTACAVTVCFLIWRIVSNIHYAPIAGKMLSQRKWYFISLEERDSLVRVCIRSVEKDRNQFSINFRDTHQSVRALEHLKSFDIIEFNFTYAMIGQQPRWHVGSYLTVKTSILS